MTLYIVLMVLIILACVVLFILTGKQSNIILEKEKEIKSLRLRIKNFQEQKRIDDMIIACDENLMNELRKRCN